jgi:hypothetical protein
MMEGMVLNYSRIAAATACLLMLALIVGPACAPLCAGSSCPSQTAASSEKVSCHGMTSEGGDCFAASPNAGRCGVAEASLAILSKPALSINSTRAAEGATVSAAAALHSQDLFARGLRFNFFSDGPPPGIHTLTLSNLVLRI